MRNWFLFLIGVFLLVGCVKNMHNVKLLSMSDDASPGKSVGQVMARDCATRYFGFGRSPFDLTIDKALSRGREEKNFRYLNNVHVENERMAIIIYERDCIVVTGEGFE